MSNTDDSPPVTIDVAHCPDGWLLHDAGDAGQCLHRPPDEGRQVTWRDAERWCQRLHPLAHLLTHTVGAPDAGETHWVGLRAECKSPPLPSLYVQLGWLACSDHHHHSRLIAAGRNRIIANLMLVRSHLPFFIPLQVAW